MKSDFFDSLRKENKDLEDIVASFEDEETEVEEEEVVEVDEVEGEVKCLCQHCCQAEVVYREGKPYSVGGDTSDEAMMIHGII